MGDETQEPLQKSAYWADHLTQRERDQIRACQAYAMQFEASGLPGHGLFMLVSNMAAMLEDAVSRFGYSPIASPPVRVQKVAYDKDANCWRDLITGVKVEVP